MSESQRRVIVFPEFAPRRIENSIRFLPDNIFLDEMGNLIKPGYITDCFTRLLRGNHLRKIQFHNLRHSCASPLLSNEVSTKQIQEWLGHSDFSTTANIYAHLDYISKITLVEAMLAQNRRTDSTAGRDGK